MVTNATVSKPAPQPLMSGDTRMGARLHRDAANDAVMEAPGINAKDFVANNRIHVKDGALFIDPYLTIHPRELDPANEGKLREKLKLTYGINNPSFYESNERFAVAINLAQLIPVSLTAKRSKLMEEVNRFNNQVDSGRDEQLAKSNADRHHPMAAIVRDTVKRPSRDPEGIETLKNGVAMYLLVREKLTNQGFLNPLTWYVETARTPDQVLGELESKIGVTPLAMREAAMKGGLDGVGQLLGLDPAYVKDVKAFSEHMAGQEFSHNQIEHWHLGRQLLGITAPLQQKLAAGMDARITHQIDKFRTKIRHYYDVPEPIKAEQDRVADALNLVEPVQRALMFKLGYEICYTPKVMADGIAKYSNIYGLHRKAANDLRDVRATYRIYFSGRGDLKGSMRTLVHEVAHNLWPEQFTAEDITKIDTLAASDAARFTKLNRVMDEKFPEFEKFLKAYQAGSDAEKTAIAQTTKAYFAGYGVSIDGGLLPYVRDANDFKFLVKHAHETLSVEGARYAKSGYNSPNERFREVISRFAELKQVELRGEPQLLHYLAPGLDDVWETQYIPHLKRVYQQVNNAQGTSAQHAEAAELPKVAERPTSAVKPPLDAPPSNEVAADSVMHGGMINERTLSAISALNSMGVHAGR